MCHTDSFPHTFQFTGIVSSTLLSCAAHQADEKLFEKEKAELPPGDQVQHQEHNGVRATGRSNSASQCSSLKKVDL